MIPLFVHDKHASDRHQQRFGEPLTERRKTAIFAVIEAARANDNRSAAACLIEIDTAHPSPRERWIVSVEGEVLQVVIPAPVLITVMPAALPRKRS